MKAVFNGRARAAIAALVFMMADNKDNVSLSLSQIASPTGVSLSYLEQIFAHLRSAKLVRSIRGPGGGYQINGDPKTLTVSDVVLALEPNSKANTFQSVICSQLSQIKLADMVNFVDEIF